MPDDKKDNQEDRAVQNSVRSIVVLVISFIVLLNLLSVMSSPVSLPYSVFLNDLKSGNVDQLTINDKEITGHISKGTDAGKQFSTVIVDSQLADQLTQHNVTFSAVNPNNIWSKIGTWIFPILFFVFFWSMLSRGAGGAGMMGQAMAMERSRAKVFHEDKVKVTFGDVAGVDEAKEELKEVISFLREPERYRKLGGHLPRGILLVGPPGTGKTLLARAVAGEAGVPFFSISGSEFVELYVGVGAARVRDLFTQAKEKAPCIIFIDELDALGKARSLPNVTGSHDEKEQTLNQLLVELDGFDPMQGIILLAATNRPEILDPALLRAGRFDRHVLVDRPDKAGRVQILKVHLRDVTINGDVDIDAIAAATPGFTGADLANLVNEAVLLGVRRNAEHIDQTDFYAAIERIVAGLEKKNRLLNPYERRVVAYHECGHALVGLSLNAGETVQKVSIIPRGIGALGYTIQRPTEDRFLMSQAELENKMAALLGGRAAEMLVFGQISTGAADDLTKATDIARNMVTRYGMSKSLGAVAYEAESQSLLQVGLRDVQSRQYSETTAREIDAAVRDLVERALVRATEQLEQSRETLDRAASELLDKETLTGEDLARIIAEARPCLEDFAAASRQKDLCSTRMIVTSPSL